MNESIPESTNLTKDRRISVSLIVLCQSFQALSMGGIALMLPLIRQDLGLSFTQAGTLAAATTLVYAIMQIPSGYLADRFSPKRLFVIGVLGSTLLSLTFGLVTDYWQALLNQTLSGVFRAFLFVPGMSLITGWFPPNRRATAIGLYIIGGATGSLFFNLIGPLLVAWFDWRFAFISISSLGIITGFFLMRLGKDSPTVVGRPKESLRETIHLFRYKIMWVSGGIQFVRLGVMQGITYWLPSMLIDEKGLSLQLAGVIVAVQAVMMAPFVVVGGYISDRLKNPIMIIGISLAALAVTTGLLVTTQNMVLVIILIFINAVFLQMYFGPIFSVPVEVLGGKKAGIANGFGNFFANMGGFAATYILGALKDSTNAFQPGFLSICGACIAGLVLTLALWQIRRTALKKL